jgi:hypothetical protein
MLKQLLALIDQGDLQSEGELANKLAISQTMLSEMLRQLVNQGYLQDLSCNTSTCDGCAAKGGCFAGNAQHVWVLTIKGRRAGLESHINP